MASRLYIKVFRTSATSAEYPKIRLIADKKALICSISPFFQHLAGKNSDYRSQRWYWPSYAICFAEHGAELLLLGRNQEKLEQLFDEIEEKSGQGHIHPMDFAKARAEDYSGLADSLDEHFPVIDGLIHNAAQLGTLVRSILPG